MFGSNPGNCLRALGTVGAVASLNMVVATQPVSSIELILKLRGSGCPYGAFSTSFGRLRTEYPQTGYTTQLELYG
ncbi:MAG: hypothetical protein KJO34_19040 [Deltaproteobacteria bacterium]|nr:hypothetical protein [Deltaproteobacteria bacterium]